MRFDPLPSERGFAFRLIEQAVKDLAGTGDVRDEAIRFFTGGGKCARLRAHWFELAELNEASVVSKLHTHLYARKRPSRKVVFLSHDEKDDLLLPLLHSPKSATDLADEVEGLISAGTIRFWLQKREADGLLKRGGTVGQYVVAHERPRNAITSYAVVRQRVYDQLAEGPHKISELNFAFDGQVSDTVMRKVLKHGLEKGELKVREWAYQFA